MARRKYNPERERHDWRGFSYKKSDKRRRIRHMRDSEFLKSHLREW